MTRMDEHNWIAIAALAVSVLVLFIGIFTKRPFVATTVADELRDEIEDLRKKVSNLNTEVVSLTAQLAMVIRDRNWWQDEYRKLKEQADKREIR